MEISVAGERLRLLPQRAALHPLSATLLVADAHVGKAVAFRKLGVPVPAGTTDEMLRRLQSLVDAYDVRRVVFLGDLLHAPQSLAPGTQARVTRWRRDNPALELVLVRGNHDARAGDPPPDWRIDVHEQLFTIGALRLQHEPEERDDGYVIAGHVHPCAWIGTRGHDRLRLPCFHVGPRCAVLPAFGGFTGMHALARGPDDRVYVIADDRVCAWPPHAAPVAHERR